MLRRMLSNKAFMGFVILPLMAVIDATILAFVLGHPTAGAMISYFGTVAVLMVAMIYIVFFDSKKHWEGQSAGKRFVNVMTFQR